MSKSVVPVAAAARAKQLVSNKKLAKHHDGQKPAQDEQHAVDHKDEAANVVQADSAQTHQLSMSDAALGGFSFAGAMSDAAASSASLTVQDSADGSYSSDDNDGSGTILLVGAVALVGAGIAVLAGGGGKGNDAPVITSAATATVAENAAASTVVYTATATDADGDAISYSLSGADAAAFNINATTGAVTLKAPADFETKSSYTFNVVATDGDEPVSKAVTLTVTNVPEAPVFTSGATATLAENSALTTVVYDANISGTGGTFALTGDDASFFNIDANTGAVTFKANPDFEAQPTYDINVVATQDGLTTTQAVVVTLTDVTEPGPVFTSGGAVSLAENVPTSTVVYDAEVLTAAGTVTYGLTGTDAGDFNINTSTGVVTFKASPDFETQSSYNFNVTAHDNNGTTAQAVVVTITDVEPENTSVSLDIGSLQTAAAPLNAGTGAITFTDNADDLTNVIIQNFTADDQIVVTEATLDDYNFTSTGGDLIINFSDNGGDPFNNIVLDNVVSNSAIVVDFNSAVAALGGSAFSDFITFA